MWRVSGVVSPDLGAVKLIRKMERREEQLLSVDATLQSLPPQPNAAASSHVSTENWPQTVPGEWQGGTTAGDFSL